MDETTREAAAHRVVRLLCRPRGGTAPAPAVLVSAWLLAELADSAAVLIEQVGSDELHLRPVEDSPTAVRSRVESLLGDVRFTGWAVAADSDTTRTLLERDVPHHVEQADSS